MTEREKIPLRIELAKELAIKDIKKGIDLEPVLKKLVKDENYCGAEGVKQALRLNRD